MRWVCRRCLCLDACREAVDEELARGQIVAGYRAGESERARSYRLKGLHSVQRIEPKK